MGPGKNRMRGSGTNSLGVNSWFPGTGQIGIMTRELDQNLDGATFKKSAILASKGASRGAQNRSAKGGFGKHDTARDVGKGGRFNTLRIWS